MINTISAQPEISDAQQRNKLYGEYSISINAFIQSSCELVTISHPHDPNAGIKGLCRHPLQ